MMKASSLQKGLSLVEVMISIALGLLLISGALQILLSSRQIDRTTDSQSRIQENGRFALDFVTQSVRMAGHKNTEEGLFSGNCGDFSPCTFNSDTVSDRVAPIFDPSNDKDCLGNDVDSEDLVANVFYIAEDPSNSSTPSLYCQGFTVSDGVATSNGAGQALVAGVENMQVLYGITDSEEDNRITSYVPVNDTATNLGRIGMVQVSFLINNGGEGTGVTEAVSYNLLDADPDADSLSFNDNFERRVYTTSIAVNNMIYVIREY